jgi:hypothetical protein
MNCVCVALPSPAFAPLIVGLMVVDMHPEHTSATAKRSTLDRILFPPKEKLSAQLLTAGESQDAIAN